MSLKSSSTAGLEAMFMVALHSHTYSYINIGSDLGKISSVVCNFA